MPTSNENISSQKLTNLTEAHNSNRTSSPSISALETGHGPKVTVKDKTLGFLIEKYVPIFLIWLAIELAMFLGGSRWDAIFPTTNSGATVLESIADCRILIAYIAGLGVIFLIFAVCKQLGFIAESDESKCDKFFEGLWSEFVGMSAHTACGLFILWCAGGVRDNSLLLQVTVLILIGRGLYRDTRQKLKNTVTDKI
jgi:hypothetical protein